MKEIETLCKIFNFDFNKDSTRDLTFEEYLMENLTNDFGDLASPQFTIIALAEFRKFIFLWYMNAQDMMKKSSKPYDIGEVDGESTKLFKSLTAPPLIDVVWRLLIQRESIYDRFWREIFDGLLERKKPSDSNASVFTNYTRTYTLLDYFSDILNPSPLLWPKLTHVDLEYELDNFVWISKKNLKTLKKIIDKHLYYWSLAI